MSIGIRLDKKKIHFLGDTYPLICDPKRKENNILFFNNVLNISFEQGLRLGLTQKFTIQKNGANF